MPPPTTTSVVAVTMTLAAMRIEGGSRKNFDMRRSIRFGGRGAFRTFSPTSPSCRRVLVTASTTVAAGADARIIRSGRRPLPPPGYRGAPGVHGVPKSAPPGRNPALRRPALSFLSQLFDCRVRRFPCGDRVGFGTLCAYGGLFGLSLERFEPLLQSTQPLLVRAARCPVGRRLRRAPAFRRRRCERRDGGEAGRFELTRQPSAGEEVGRFRIDRCGTKRRADAVDHRPSRLSAFVLKQPLRRARQLAGGIPFVGCRTADNVGTAAGERRLLRLP